MYKVIRKFKDKDERVYKVGDVYPSPDAKKATNARIKVLSTTANEYSKIFIQKVDE